MASRGLTVDEIMAILPETPGRIAALTERLTATQLHARPGPDAWSVNDVLAHLRACHDVLAGTILRILAEDRPRWKGMHPRAWIKKTDYLEWEFAPAFEVFRKQRAHLLAVLEPLPPDGWQRTGHVTGMRGEASERSAESYADWMAVHERAHWKQIERIIEVVVASRPPSVVRQNRR